MSGKTKDGNGGRAREEEAGDAVGEMLTQRTPRRAQEAPSEAEDEPKGP